MDAPLALIQRLRREHRAILERLAEASPEGRGAPASPTPAAVRNVTRAVAHLHAQLPVHFKRNGCMTCPNARSCGGASAHPGSCHDGPERTDHGALWQAVQALAHQLSAAPQPMTKDAWGPIRLQVNDLAAAFRSHLEHEEEDFHQRVLALGQTRRTRATS